MIDDFDILDIVGKDGGTIMSECGKIVIETPTKNILKIKIYDNEGTLSDELLYTTGLTLDKGKNNDSRKD